MDKDKEKEKEQGNPNPIKVGISIGDINGIGTEVIMKSLNDSRLLLDRLSTTITLKPACNNSTQAWLPI